MRDEIDQNFSLGSSASTAALAEGTQMDMSQILAICAAPYFSQYACLHSPYSDKYNDYIFPPLTGIYSLVYVGKVAMLNNNLQSS